MQKEFRGIADPDQAWILGELIRYLEHTRSGALEFDDMGESWTGVRDSVAAGTLRATDKGIPTVVARFDALLRFTSLSLGRRLGTEVVPVLSRKELADPSLRTAALTQQLAGTGQLTGVIRIPDTIGHLIITADLRASTVTCHVDIDAPREGRPTTRVNWLVRQLKNTPTARVSSASLPTPAEHRVQSSSAPFARTPPRSSPTPPARSGPSASPSAPRSAPSAAVAGSLHRLSPGRRRQLLRPSARRPQSVVRGTAQAAPRDPGRPDDREPTRPPSLSSTDFSSQDGSVSDVGYSGSSAHWAGPRDGRCQPGLTSRAAEAYRRRPLGQWRWPPASLTAGRCQLMAPSARYVPRCGFIRRDAVGGRCVIRLMARSADGRAEPP